ncbi:MAG: hypothetical protein IT374_18675 [Polyangiaceae bacterium]|nr:hypothetical protein [Polyangiaceae bacterium]
MQRLHDLHLRVEGDGVDHQRAHAAIGELATRAFWAFWDTPDVRHAVLARLPGYRLSTFQGCPPERFAREVIERYLLDVDGAVRWLGG